MLKILMAAPIPPPYGGIANWVIITRKLIGCDETVMLTDIINTAPSSGKSVGRSLFDRVVLQGFGMLKQRKEMIKSIRRDRPDVMYITTAAGLGILRDIAFLKLAERYKIPAIYHIHCGRISNVFSQSGLYRHIFKMAVELSSKVVAIDRKTYSVLAENFGTSKTCYLPNYIDCLKGNIEHSSSKEVIFVGWCTKEKGIEELLRVWDDLSLEYPDWILRLVGPYDPSYMEKLLSYHKNNSLIIEGEKSHEAVLSLLANASVFVLPSYTEGFPYSVLEAMAQGKVIIATDVGEIGEMLGDACGIVVPPKDANALKSALETVINDTSVRTFLGKNANTKAMKEYSTEIVFPKLKNIWREATK